MKFCFGDIVVVEDIYIGVIVKSWIGNDGNNHDVYVRMKNQIVNYKESDIQRYMVRHMTLLSILSKYLNEEELEYQYNAVNGQ